jgi:hypothetical protein
VETAGVAPAAGAAGTGAGEETGAGAVFFQGNRAALREKSVIAGRKPAAVEAAMPLSSCRASSVSTEARSARPVRRPAPLELKFRML